MHDDVHRLPLLDQQRNGVGELQFATGARLDPAQRVKDLAVQDVSARRGQVRRRVGRLGLLHHALELLDVRVVGVGQFLDVEDAVGADPVAGHLDRAQHRSAATLPGARHHLEHAAGQHQVVGQQNGDGVLIVVEVLLHAPDRVPEAQRLLLHHGRDFEQRGGLAHLGQHRGLAALGEGVLQDEVLDEVRDHTVLAGRGDDEQTVGAGGLGLLGHQLDSGSVDDGQQLFGHRLRGGQEARTQTGGRDHRGPRDRRRVRHGFVLGELVGMCSRGHGITLIQDSVSGLSAISPQAVQTGEFHVVPGAAGRPIDYSPVVDQWIL